MLRSKSHFRSSLLRGWCAVAATAMALAVGAAPAAHAGSGPDIDVQDAVSGMTYDLDDTTPILLSLCKGVTFQAINLPPSMNGISGSFAIYRVSGNKLVQSGSSTVSGGAFSLSVSALAPDTYYTKASITYLGTVYSYTSNNFTVTCSGGGGGGGGGGLTTPELGSGELLALGVIPISAVLFYRRRARRRAPSGGDQPKA